MLRENIHAQDLYCVKQCLILYGWALNTVQQCPTAMESPCIPSKRYDRYDQSDLVRLRVG